MKISPAMVSGPLYTLYRAWCHSMKFSEEGREKIDALWAEQKPMVFALWHDELFPFMHVKRNLEIVTVVSQSNDGEVLAQVLEKLGLHTARGSSSRGGVKALLKAARMMRGGLCACITIDGPRGPRHTVKEGAIFLAQRTPAHIVPMRVELSSKWVFGKAWDKFQLPKPFSRARIVFGEPYLLDVEKMTVEQTKKECEKLKAKLEGLLL